MSPSALSGDKYIALLLTNAESHTNRSSAPEWRLRSVNLRWKKSLLSNKCRAWLDAACSTIRTISIIIIRIFHCVVVVVVAWRTLCRYQSAIQHAARHAQRSNRPRAKWPTTWWGHRSGPLFFNNNLFAARAHIYYCEYNGQATQRPRNQPANIQHTFNSVCIFDADVAVAADTDYDDDVVIAICQICMCLFGETSSVKKRNRRGTVDWCI